MRARAVLPSPYPSPCDREREPIDASLAPAGGEPSGSGAVGEGQQRWTQICSVDDIPQLGARVVRRAQGPNVAVFRTAADRLFALADRCPHRGGPLSQGIVFGERVACPLHNTCVELDSGCAVAPDKGRVQSFPVKIEAHFVYVDLEARASEEIEHRGQSTPSLHPKGVADVEPPLGGGSRG